MLVGWLMINPLSQYDLFHENASDVTTCLTKTLTTTFIDLFYYYSVALNVTNEVQNSLVVNLFGGKSVSTEED